MTENLQEKTVSVEDLPERAVIAAYEFVANLLAKDLLPLTIEVSVADDGKSAGNYEVSISAIDAAEPANTSPARALAAKGISLWA